MLVIENKAKIQALIVIFEFIFILAVRAYILSDIQTSGVWEWFVFSLVFFFVLPYITIRFLFKDQLTYYYVGWGDTKKALVSNLAIFMVLLAAMGLIVVGLDWTKVFPVFFWVRGGVWLTVFIDLFLLSTVVFSLEFFFRGFLMETVRRSWGTSAAICISTLLAFTYSAFSTDTRDVIKLVYLMAINGILGLLAFKNRSIAITFVLHWALLVSIDMFAVYKLSQ